MHPLTNLASRCIPALILGAATSPAANATPPDDACALLTTAQVSAALGVAVGPGSYVTPTFHKTCTWQATSSGGGTVTLYLQGLAGYEGGKKLAAYGNAVTAQAIGGIGDEAYYFITGGQVVSLGVKKGGIALKVSVYAKIPVEKKQAVEKALALQALAKL